MPPLPRGSSDQLSSEVTFVFGLLPLHGRVRSNVLEDMMVGYPFGAHRS